MGTTSKSWHAAVDSPEEIEMCLVCRRPSCVDCIGRRLDSDGRPKRSKKKVDDRHIITDATEKVLKLYATAKCDREVSEKSGLPLGTVSAIRKRFDLPAMRYTSPKKRSELVEQYLRKED